MTDFDNASPFSRRKLLQAGAAAATLGAIPNVLQRAAHAQSRGFARGLPEGRDGQDEDAAQREHAHQVIST